MFNENAEEWSVKQNKKIEVFKTAKYEESKHKAIEIIESGKYGLSESDFWILMNETKMGKMAYTGLIISHNGCLKINDGLDEKFKPECVTMNEHGWGDSLVFTYNSPTQGLYEVGEVSTKNCKIDYPYAMAFKRMFDRVVLKLSKLAYAGIYGEDEADEFRDPLVDNESIKKPKRNNPAPKKPDPPKEEVKAEEKPMFKCEACGKPLAPYNGADGKPVSLRAHAERSKQKFGKVLCIDCIKNESKAN